MRPCDQRTLHGQRARLCSASGGGERTNSTARGRFVYLVWGDALGEFERVRPQARIINLETAVTCSDDRMAKGINYRMNPANISCLTAAGIDCCVLTNNHVLDWGMSGLTETLATLRAAAIKTSGAGKSEREAWAPAVLPLSDNHRLSVFSFGTETSGIPPAWAATGMTGGVAFLPDLSERTAQSIVQTIRAHKRRGDLVVASVHWGSNWGYGASADEARFAHALIDGGADLFQVIPRITRRGSRYFTKD